MPLLSEKKEDKFSFAIWDVKENLSFFQNHLTLAPHEKNEIKKYSQSRLLEWYASRFLLALMHGQKNRENIYKDKYGKPFFERTKTNLSISHSENLVAAALSPVNIGLDLQVISEKVKIIKHKFLSARELHYCKDDLLCLNKMWTIKEAVYKAYGKKGLIFKENIKVSYFFKDKNGYIADAEIYTNIKKIKYRIFSYDFEKAILSIAIEKEK